MNVTLLEAIFLFSLNMHFSVSAEVTDTFGKIFLELTSAVSLYMKEEFKLLLWLVARCHLIPSQPVLLCIRSNISLTVLPARYRTEYRFSFTVV